MYAALTRMRPETLPAWIVLGPLSFIVLARELFPFLPSHLVRDRRASAHRFPLEEASAHGLAN